MNPYKSLRARITAQILGFSLIPILVVGMFAAYSMSNAEKGADSSMRLAREDIQENVVSVSLVNGAIAMSREITALTVSKIVDLVQIMATPTVMELAMGQGDPIIGEMYLNAQV